MAEKFFYTTHHPYKWTSGPTFHTYDLENTQEIDSLERAKELAEEATVGGGGESRVETSYGVYYEVENPV